MYKFIILFLGLCLPFFAVSCSNRSPESVTEKYMSAIYSEDVEAFKDVIIQARADQDQAFIEVSIRSLKQDLTNRYGKEWIRSAEYTELSMDDDIVTVQVRINKDENSIKVQLIKEGDQWKVQY